MTDFERLERVWSSSANQPGEAAQAYLMEDVMNTLAKRRRDFRIQIGLIGLALLVWTGMMAHATLVREVIDPSREWGAALLMLVAWALYGIVIRQYRRHIDAFPDPEASMPETLRALIDENATSRRRVRTMAIALPLFIGAMAIALGQMQAIGKMTPSNIRDFSLLATAGLLCSAATFGIRYFRTLRPEARRLKRLLQEYEQG